MITQIFGAPRVGKTALMTMLALENMQPKVARAQLKSCHRIVENLNGGGFNLSFPYSHLVFSDYSITARRGKLKSWEIDGFFLGLPNNDGHATHFLPPYANIFLDESQKYYNSRLSNSLSDFVSRYYELHGHYHLNIFLASQRPGLIDLNIRDLSTKIIEVVDLKHKYKHGRIIASEWICNEFDNVAKAEKYIGSGKDSSLSGKKVSYKFDGNIFKHYDSFGFFPTHLKDRYNEDFHLQVSKKCGYTVEEIKEFNVTHNYVVPETYRKGKKKA